jgi:predicted nuclease of restriction endonuclease-like (RecB) superfamily
MSNLDKNILFDELKSIIDAAKQEAALSVNAILTATYWQVGNRISKDILNQSRANYGEETIKKLSIQLTQHYGKGWSAKQLLHCLRFAETFADYQTVSALWRQLSWTHFKTIMYVNDPLARDFYLQLCRTEKWSTRTLKQKIDGLLFERTAISRKPAELAKQELQALEQANELSLDLVFKSHYVLDFLNLRDTYSENDLEQAILNNIEEFLMELGDGFSFVSRQKRMTIDQDDFYLDLLFYHRKLQRLIAIELKLGKFKPAYKGQMELYLRWLEKHEKQPHENSPIGLMLCAKGNQEQIQLLQLDKENIKVAEYITQTIPTELLQQKLTQFVAKAQQQIQANEAD